jgi:hypothetical protein
VVLYGITDRARGHGLGRKLGKKIVDCGIRIEADFHGIGTEESPRKDAAWQSLDVIALDGFEHDDGYAGSLRNLTK